MKYVLYYIIIIIVFTLYTSRVLLFSTDITILLLGSNFIKLIHVISYIIILFFIS